MTDKQYIMITTTFDNKKEEHKVIETILEENNTKVIATHLRDKTREVLLSENINNIYVREDFSEIII